MSSAVAGTLPLLRPVARHDGRHFAPWVVITTLLSVSSVLGYPQIFPTQQDRMALAVAIGANPALGLIFGPAFDLSTTDGFNAWRSLALGGFLVGLGAIFTLIRATRAQEDSGQAELLASGVVGRDARLMAGVVTTIGLTTVLGVVVGVATGLTGGDWESSLLLGATMTATGWMCAGIAAVTAQIGSEARASSSFAVATLGVLFLLRGLAYSMDAPDWTVWANPLGWMTETRPGVDNVWWPLLPAAGLTMLLLVAAFALQGRRDFGMGAITPRPGPARGAVRSTMALALRVNRGPLIAWGIAFVLLGFVYGYFTTSIQELLARDSAVQQFLAAGAASADELVGAFVVTVLNLLGILTAIPGVQVMLRVRAEELAERVEPVMATSVARPGYYAGNLLLAFAAPAVYLLIAGTLVATLASRADIGVGFTDTLLQAVATVPAVWTVVAVAVLVVGARPQVTLAAWAGVLLAFVLTLLGPTFKLRDEVLAISPFWHVPNMATDESRLGLVWISMVTPALVLAGFAGFRRRDLGR